MNKYELTNVTIKHSGTTLYQIKALMDFDDIRKGDLGGYIEGVSNLEHSGNAWVYGNAKVCGDAEVFGNAKVTLVCTTLYNTPSSYNVTIVDSHIIIGCQCLSLRQWEAVDSSFLYYKEWITHKDIIIALAKHLYNEVGIV